jgi:hypothetical protein
MTAIPIGKSAGSWSTLMSVPRLRASGKELRTSVRRMAEMSTATSMTVTVDLARQTVATDTGDPDAAAIRVYVSRLWAEDWDSPEDQIYDSW